jgi:AcrR family transcriptional regulator
MEGLTKIMHAAVDLFLQYGFKNVTMDDIARRAGISKKTLYQHYTNKHDVVSASVTWYQNLKIEHIKSVLNTASNAIEAMVRVDHELASIYRKLNPVALLELQRFYPEGYERFRQVLLTQDVEMIRQTVKRGMDEGLFRPELDPDFTARYRIETALMCMQSNLMVNDRYSLIQVGSAITEMFIYGIVTPKGEKLYTRYKEKYCPKNTAQA